MLGGLMVNCASVCGMAMQHQATTYRPQLCHLNFPRFPDVGRSNVSIRNSYEEIRCSLTSRHSAFSNLRRLHQAPSFQDRLYIHVENWTPPRRRIVRSELEDSSRQRDVEKKMRNSKGLTSLELQNGGSSRTRNSYNGIFLLLLLNLGIYALDHWLHFPVISHLYLHHQDPRWYQFVTATFCHINWTHLSSNLFFLYIFGKLIEEEEGGLAVWLSYLITGVGANLVSWLLLPRSVISAGASGAVFGLFAVSVLVKMSFDWRKILEVLILGQFVVEKVMEEAQASASMGSFALKSSMNINHIAHLSGALLGVILICLLHRLPSGDPDKK
ncbi:hypothetical protein R1flu_011562 [Riccia fluitans]|uniref:Peptidase S54 rhomboid domain-containing protein n=1 Tax=Riccia fluitans TaxID=41844 RepID=A0ABD1Z8D9_9MARC